MRTIQFALLTIFGFAPATILAQANDTLIVNNPSQVIISQNDDTLSVRISGKEDNPDYRFSREVSLSNQSEVSTSQSINHRSPLSWDFMEIERNDKTSLLELRILKDFSAGFLATFDRPTGMDNVKFFRSFEYNLSMSSIIFYPGRSRNWYSIDFNIVYRQMKMKGDMRFVADRNDEVRLAPYPDDAKPDFTMLQTLRPEISISFNRSFSQDFSFGISLAAIFKGNQNLSLCRTHYTDNENNNIRQVDDIEQALTHSYSIKAQLIANGIGGIYLKYYPKSGFKSGHGPQFHTLSMGMVFILGK